LKAALNLAYKQVAKANKQSHESNKQRYDLRAKPRRFEIKEMVFLYNPAVKKGLTRKFNRPWHGPYQITKRISELNYEITDRNGKKQVVHVNRLKRAHNVDPWTPLTKPKTKKNPPKKPVEKQEESEEYEIKIGPFPLVSTEDATNRTEPEHQSHHDMHTPNSAQLPTSTSPSELRDSCYQPPETPKTRRELEPTRIEPSLTHFRASNLLQNPESQ
jgi:hypothetical protein